MMKVTAQQRHTALTLLLSLQILCNSSSFSPQPSIPSKSLSSIKLSNTRTPFKPPRSKPSHLHSSNDETNNTNSRSRRRPPKPRKDLYAILGASPSAPKSELKRLYISLAKQTHPDSSSYNQKSSEDFSEIVAAYKILSDDKLRRRYDREVAAEEFKGDVVAVASGVAREYGPVARKFYEDWALPFLKRTTASTVAGLSAITEVTSEQNLNNNVYNAQSERTRTMGSNSRRGTPLQNGATLSEVVSEMTQMERQNNGGVNALEDFGKAFQRVIEAGRNATRKIDGAELQEKSVELRMRADEARAESLQILEQLTKLKSERLRLTFHNSKAPFTSSEALQFLDGLNTQDNDENGYMVRMGFTHSIGQDIELFRVAEVEFEKRTREKNEVDEQAEQLKRELERAEKSSRDAELELSEAKRRLEQAQLHLTATQNRVTETQRDLTTLNTSIKRADTELTKSEQHLKRKRDVVRRGLKRKDEVYGKEEPTFDTADDGSVQLNNAFDKSSMDENQSMERIEQLKREEGNIESEFLMLVEKASRLVSRSERLRMRSEVLLGVQLDSGEEVGGDMGTVVGESFGMLQQQNDVEQSVQNGNDVGELWDNLVSKNDRSQ